MERRRPREHFTRVLTRICERLSKSSESEVRWTDRFFKETRVNTVSVRALWVVGSYARGALDCGDLDLVIEATASQDEKVAGLPPTSAISRALFNSPADVRLYVGTPDKNSSGVAFDEARLVWSCECPDWRSAIDAIRPDETAGRFVRPADAIPFRQEQIDAYDDTITELISLERANIVQWKFMPCSESVVLGTLRADEADFIELATAYCGKQTQRLLPYLIELFRRESTWPTPRWVRGGRAKTEFRIGGCDILVGRPGIPIARLDEVSTSEIALFPHLTRRGPNGICLLARGDEHPLLKRATGITVFCHVDEEGEPIEIECVNERGYEARTFDLFERESMAIRRAKSDEREFETTVNVRAISGRDLLALLAFADFIYFKNSDVTLTFAGQLFLDTDSTMDAGAVLDKLGSIKAT